MLKIKNIKGEQYETARQKKGLEMKINYANFIKSIRFTEVFRKVKKDKDKIANKEYVLISEDKFVELSVNFLCKILH